MAIGQDGAHVVSGDAGDYAAMTAFSGVGACEEVVLRSARIRCREASQPVGSVIQKVRSRQINTTAMAQAAGTPTQSSSTVLAPPANTTQPTTITLPPTWL